MDKRAERQAKIKNPMEKLQFPRGRPEQEELFKRVETEIYERLKEECNGECPLDCWTEEKLIKHHETGKLPTWQYDKFMEKLRDHNYAKIVFDDVQDLQDHYCLFCYLATGKLVHYEPELSNKVGWCSHECEICGIYPTIQPIPLCPHKKVHVCKNCDCTKHTLYYTTHRCIDISSSGRDRGSPGPL